MIFIIKPIKLHLKVLALALLVPYLVSAQNNKPNVIFILADDLGYADLSSYGQQLFSTPNIDKLVNNGLKFTNHYAGTSVCAPSRSALVSGFHTGHSVIRGNKGVLPEGQYPIPDSTYTIFELFKDAGYATGVFGKWGLGYPGSEGSPLKQGVDSFYGYNCQTLAHHYYPDHLWDNEEKVILAQNEGGKKNIYAPLLIHQKALDFLDTHKDEPFFMFYPTTIPHAELVAPQAYMDLYKNKYLPEKVYNVSASDKEKRGYYASQPETHAAFVAMIKLLDDQVGEIMQKVRDLGLEQNTIIIFSSDNGPHQEGGADPDYFNSNGNLRGYKRDLYEGGIRVPLAISWKGKIKPAQTDLTSAFWDFMPTFQQLLGAKKTPTDGISLLPTLLNQGKQKQHDYLYWEFHEMGGRQAIRMGNWKAVKYNVSKPLETSFELYNLKADPSETTDVSKNYPEIVKKMVPLFESSRTVSPIFNFGN